MICKSQFWFGNYSAGFRIYCEDRAETVYLAMRRVKKEPDNALVRTLGEITVSAPERIMPHINYDIEEERRCFGIIPIFWF